MTLPFFSEITHGHDEIMSYRHGIQLEILTKTLYKYIILYDFVPLLDRFFHAGFLYFFYHRGLLCGTYDAAILVEHGVVPKFIIDTASQKRREIPTR
tara:strand:- start:196 stop:486 length:291 start_codon:yes stop_codon:yes gene_type:complete